MLNFKCSNCQNDINVAHQYMGDMIQCPFCVALQIVPDQIMSDGTDYQGYTIVRTLAASILWTTYEATQQPHNPALCIPTSFFLKRVSDFPAFADKVAVTSALNIPELPTLLNHGATPENEFFVFDYQQNAYKISSFITENPLGVYNALMVARNIANCLANVWEQYGLLHQCLIPDNISVSHDFNVRIKNIGLSEFLLQDHPLLEQGFNIWDYHFISPEFMNEGLADSPACDIYSLGGILFYLCSGHYPHEDLPPDSIALSPAPSLRAYVPEAPESLEVLVQMMMSPTIEGRLVYWHEVIKHIDTILANQSAANSTIYYFNSQSSQTDYHSPVGLSAGDLTQAIQKEKAMIDTTSDPKIAAHKTIKPIAKSNLSTMNKKWSRKKALNPKRKPKNNHRHDSDERPKTTPKKDSTTPMVITLSLAALVTLVIVIIILINANSKQKKKHRRRKTASPTVSKTYEQKFASADAKQRELLLKQGIDLTKLNPDANKTTTTTTSLAPKETPKVIKKPRTTSRSELKSKLNAIDEYYKSNPGKASEALRRYEELMTAAVKAKSFNTVDVIQEKINALPEGTEAATAPDPKIEAVLKAIKEQILPMLKAEQYDDALRILLEYDGELAAESKTQRVALSIEIKDRIAKIQNGKLTNNGTTTQTASATSQNPADVLKKVAKLVAPQLMKGEVKTAKAQIDMALTTAGSGPVKQHLSSWSTQIENYEKLKPSLEGKDSADTVITENATIMENAFLLKGLLYKDKEQLIQAKQAFEKLPYFLGDVFVSAMENNLNE